MTRELEDRVQASAERTQRLGAQFVITDLEVALALTDRAATQADPQKRQRTLGEARRALEVVDGLLQRLTPSPREWQQIRQRRDVLIARLAELDREAGASGAS